jgi:hypothetical protein
VGDIKHERCGWCGRVTKKATRVEWKAGGLCVGSVLMIGFNQKTPKRNLPLGKQFSLSLEENFFIINSA